MLILFKAILNDEAKMHKYKSDPFMFAIFMAIYQYVKDGNKLSDLSCFKNIDFGNWEDFNNTKNKG
jgi:hypothetical protein